jgi:hypothetical protein
MGVTLTTNLSLIKPDGTEKARLWVDDTEEANDKLVVKNNLILTNAIAAVEMQTYVPELQAVTTNPNLGSSPTKLGFYSVLPGDFVFGLFSIRAGSSGVTAGSGFYQVTLPFVIDGSFHDVTGTYGASHVIGQARLEDNSAGQQYLAAIQPMDGFSPRHAGFALEKFNLRANNRMNAGASSAPFILAAFDRIDGQFFYKAII